MKHKIPDVSKFFKVSAPYSYVVQQGNMLYVSGIPGMDYEKGELAGTDFESQASHIPMLYSKGICSMYQEYQVWIMRRAN